jgi:hypothetical protein
MPPAIGIGQIIAQRDIRGCLIIIKRGWYVPPK